MRTFLLSLMVVPIFGALVTSASLQETGTSTDLTDVVKTLNKPDYPSFKTQLYVPSGIMKEDRDETVQSVYVYDGASTLHSTWFQLFYNQNEALVMRNKERLHTPEADRYHRWWIRGTSSAFVDRGTVSLLKMPDLATSNSTDNLRTLVSIFYQFLLFPNSLAGEDATVSKTDTAYRIQWRAGESDGQRTFLNIRVDRTKNRITRLQFTQRSQPSFYRTHEQNVSLRVRSYDNSEILPSEATFSDADGTDHRVSFTNRTASEESSYNPNPAWYQPDRKASVTEENRCGTDLFHIARKAGFYEQYEFQKRLKVHQDQVKHINSCYDQAKQPHITERELQQGLTFSKNASYIPSGTSSESVPPTSFMVFLRLVRLVKEGQLTPKKTGSISIPNIYSTAVQLLAFRSSIRSIKQAKAFTSQLERVTGQYNLRISKLFVHELQLWLLGKEDEKGFVQKKGKTFLASIQEESEPTLSSTILMARLYHQLGYFQKADKAYAGLVNRGPMFGEVKNFIRSARTKASACLNALTVEDLAPKEILYIAGLNAKNKNVESLRANLNSFLNIYEQHGDTTLFLEDVYVLRSALKLLLKNDHKQLVRSILVALIRRGNVHYLQRRYMHPIVDSAFGTTPSDVYGLIRYLKDPEHVTSFMDLNSALEVAVSKLESGEGDQRDYEFVARSVSVLIKKINEVPERWVNQLKKGRKSYPSSPIISEVLGDLFLRKVKYKNAADAYQKTLTGQLHLLKKESTKTFPREVPSYYPAYSDLDGDPPEPRIEQPLIMKYALVCNTIDRIESASDRIRDLAKHVGKPSNLSHWVRDPGVSANYQMQYSGWALYYLGKTQLGIKILRKTARRERGQYPYGSFQNTATNGLSRLFWHQNKQQKSLKVLRTAALQELDQRRLFRYRGNAGEAYVRRATEQNRMSRVIDFLKQVAQAEWLRMTTFSYSDSATEQLVNTLFKQERPDHAFQILNMAFYRSLVEKPLFQSGTAPYEFVQKLKEKRHVVDALVVAREFSKIYPDDPKPLREEINSLQKAVEKASLVAHFIDRFSQDPSKQTRQNVTEILSEQNLNGGGLSPGDQIIEQLSKLGPGVISVLDQRRSDASSNSKQQKLNVLIRLLGWNKIRSLYQRPNFFREKLFVK